MSRGAGRGNVSIDNELLNVSVTGTPTITGATGWIDTTGTARGYKNADGKPRISMMPYGYDLAEGNLTNHSPWGIIGYNDNIGTLEESVSTFSNAYTFPTVSGQLEVVSDSANDTGTGTGIRTVNIRYLKSDYTVGVTTLTMAGLTPVATGVGHADIFRVNSFVGVTAGSLGVSAGNITLRYASAGAVQGRISTGQTVSRQGFYTVPSGYCVYLTKTLASCVGLKYLIYTFRSNSNPLTFARTSLFYPFFEIALLNDHVDEDYIIPRKFGSTVDIAVSVRAEAAGSIGTCSLSGWIEPE